MKATKIDGLYREVKSTEPWEGGEDKVYAAVVTRVVTDRASSGKNPGPGWFQVTGSKREWTRRKEIVSRLLISKAAVVEWPVGCIDVGQTLETHAEILRPHMDSAVEAGGSMARRERPDLSMELVCRDFIDAGLAIPNDREWDALLTGTWDRHRIRRKKTDEVPFAPPKSRAPKPGDPFASASISDESS